MKSDNLKIARDRLINGDVAKDKKNEKQVSAIEKARRREINKQVFRPDK